MLQEVSAQSLNTVMLFSAGAILAVVGGLAMFLMPLRFRLAIMTILAVPQLIVPGLIESASVFQVWVASCGIVAMIREKPKFPSIYGKLLATLAILALVAALWSPLINISMIAAMQVISLLIIALHAAYVLKESPAGLTLAFRWLSVSVIAEAALVVLFRLRPDLEGAFLQTQVAKLLIGTEKLNNFFAGSPDNVFDPEKAGGLWLNANTASMFLGVAACAFVVAYKRYQSKWFLVTAAIAASSISFAGSKTGLVLLATMPLIAWVTPLLARRRGRAWILPTALVAFPVFLAVQSLIDAILPAKFAEDSALSLGTRAVIWDVASELFMEHPVLGLGFGGWGENFFAYSGGALGRTFPPHNILIATWSDYGIGGAAVLVALIIALIFGHLRRMGSPPVPVSSAWGWSLAAFLWTWIHGMADATTFYGDIRTATVLGLLTGFLLYDPQVAEIKRVRLMSSTTDAPFAACGPNAPSA
ncbi:hypothetical protein StoSoilA2_34120 [Arthrobacter sp. StoSoilA2]|uniref:O-antigen ligase family protein n=1 Tax=Arthrobacter sp. StoSoilA2 TaxID=2830990 RepID=UPI001CC7AD49|nr:O-antigen ligase family protein [Arthrobacter sp. StoSoilA2]BCW37356.1 hypothetical protein StoSoilA2_34120 [Arthrobacter sp. StoSoilA2]